MGQSTFPENIIDSKGQTAALIPLGILVNVVQIDPSLIILGEPKWLSGASHTFQPWNVNKRHYYFKAPILIGSNSTNFCRGLRSSAADSSTPQPTAEDWSPPKILVELLPMRNNISYNKVLL